MEDRHGCILSVQAILILCDVFTLLSHECCSCDWPTNWLKSGFDICIAFNWSCNKLVLPCFLLLHRAFEGIHDSARLHRYSRHIFFCWLCTCIMWILCMLKMGLPYSRLVIPNSCSLEPKKIRAQWGAQGAVRPNHPPLCVIVRVGAWDSHSLLA